MSMLANLPADPDEQLRLGLRVVEHAYRGEIRGLEHEVSTLRAQGQEQQNACVMLEKRLGEMQDALQRSEQRNSALSAESVALMSDKTQLQQEVHELQARLAKLQDFKRSILKSLKDDDPVPSLLPPAPTTAPPRPSMGAVSSTSCSSPPTYAQPAAYAQPASYNGSPTSGGAWPPPAMPAAEGEVDGKDFFRQARLRLTSEQFNAFLANIKRLNEVRHPARRAARRTRRPARARARSTCRGARRRWSTRSRSSAPRGTTCSSRSRACSPSTASARAARGSAETESERRH